MKPSLNLMDFPTYNEDQIVPLFESVCLSSKLKTRFTEHLEKQDQDCTYRVQVSLIFNANIYFVTVTFERTDIEEIPPAITVEVFGVEEKEKLKRFIQATFNLVESQEWSILQFSDNKLMNKDQFFELRNLWMKNIPTNN